MTAVIASAEMLNRDGVIDQAGWIHLIAKGEVPITLERPDGSMAKLVQVYDDAGLRAIVNSFDEQARSLMAANRWAGLLLDWDHFSNRAGMPSEAAGWIMELQMRDDGVWGRIEWTDKGRESVSGKQYKFASVVHSLSNCDVLGGGRVRPLSIEKAALTNEPRNKLLTPHDVELVNRAEKIIVDAISESGTGESTDGTSHQRGKSNMDYKAKLNEMLGLAPEATDADIQSACDAAAAKQTELVDACASKDAALNAATEQISTANAAVIAATEKATEIGAKVESLENRITDLTTKLVEADLIVHADVIKDAAAVRAQLLTNRDGTLAVLAGLHAPAGRTLENRSARAEEQATGLDRTVKAFAKK